MSNLKIEKKEKNLPLVTVITATYNILKNGRKETFIQSLESVHNQTYKNVEHIIIDGASNDGTIQLLEDYQKKGWFKYYSEPDKGIYDAMNKGILKAKGKYVVCLNSDDFYCDEHAIEWLVEQAEQENADACYANATKVHPQTLEKTFDWKGKENFLPWSPAFPCHQTFIIKTDVLKELGLYKTKYKGCSDNAFLIRMVHHNKKFTNIDKYIITFRDGGFSDNHMDIVKIEKTEALFEELGQYLNWTKEDCSYYVWHRFLQLPLDEAISLGCKLGNPKWMEQYFSRLLKKVSTDVQKGVRVSNLEAPFISKRIYRFFGIIPLFKISRNEIKTNVRLFCFLPFLKIQKRSEKDTRIYLFSFIPVLSLKKTNRHKYVNLFNAIPLLKVNRNYICKTRKNLLWMKMLSKFLKTASLIPLKRNVILLIDNLFEKNSNIQDNFTFFQHLYRQKTKELIPYYVLHSESPHRKDLIKKYGKHIILWNPGSCNNVLGLRLLLLMPKLRYVCDSFQSIKRFPFSFWNTVRNSQYMTSIFTQHGISFFKPDYIAPDVYGKNIFDKVLVSNDIEKQLFIERALFSPEDIIQNGLTRWDNIRDLSAEQSEKSIFIFFTTRHYLSKISDIQNSVYVTEIYNLLERIKKSIHGVKIKMALHHSSANRLFPVFKQMNVDLVDEDCIFHAKQFSSLLITDYSSMCFDFFLQGKPVIFYSLNDKDDCKKSDNMADVVNPLLGKENLIPNIVTRQDELIKLLTQYVNNHFQLSAEEKEKQNLFFYYKSDFCERLRKYLVAHLKKDS